MALQSPPPQPAPFKGEGEVLAAATLHAPVSGRASLAGEPGG